MQNAIKVKYILFHMEHNGVGGNKNIYQSIVFLRNLEMDAYW